MANTSLRPKSPLDSKALDIVLVIVASLALFLFMSWMALGSVFIPLFLQQDAYVLGIGDGTSMYPTIKPGDYVIIDTTPEKLEVGDIVVFMHNGELIGHRIVWMHGNVIITKGDNNNFLDMPIDRSKIIGEVKKVIEDPVSKYIAEIWFVGVRRI